MQRKNVLHKYTDRAGFFVFFKENLETSLPGGQGGDIEANGDVKGEGVLTTIEWLWIGGTWAPNSLLFCGHHK